jgi:adenosylmethionine-8-amino-7-oxononanoate aminotransferase
MNDLIKRDLKTLWHPCSQMKDYESFKPLIVRSALGSYIELSDGRKIIDAISSWWCKSLGHGHPRLKQALINQLEQFEHVILANTTNHNIINLSEKLCGLTKTLKKALYASDGSCAVEMAMKLSLHSRVLTGDLKRYTFMALSNGYHGETSLALSVSDLGIYKDAYKKILINTVVLNNIPYVKNRTDPLWEDCSEIWPAIEKQLEQHTETLTAIIIEPIIQGAGGMMIYSKDFLKRLRIWTKQHNVHLIADEIMTGLGRTGLPLACHHADIEPDFLCLGKGLTSGFLPLSAVLTSDTIYNLFYDDYELGKSFLHSHTHSGNALAVSVALETLNILETENMYAQIQDTELLLAELMTEVAENTGKLKNIRYIGGVVAADLDPVIHKRMGYAVYQQAVKLGALLRPLGNTLYWLPPLNTSKDTLYELKEITQKAILLAYK